jgi:cohesin complex subunit SCC1
MLYPNEALVTDVALGPVWASAKQGSKLSKNHVLQSNVANSVAKLMSASQWPISLRLHAHMLLGVVRIYQRKTRYLLDDCNEALLKIKMAFRSTGNNDMAVHLQVANREALLLPDKITPYDNLDLPPPPDASWLLSQVEDVAAAPVGRKGRVSNNRDINLQEDFDNSQFLQAGNGMDEDQLDTNVELDLDFGFDMEGDTQTMEVGRDAPAPGPMEDDVFSELDIMPRVKDLGEGEPSTALFGDDDVRIADEEGDIAMGDDDFQFNAGDQSTMAAISAGTEMQRARISESPLSDIDEQFAKEVEAEYTAQNLDLYEPQEEAEHALVRRPAQRARKQKVLMPDDEIALSSTHIKQQQVDRNNIIKPASFLPRDPFLLSLMEMQKSGGFVSSIILEGRSAAWAPELRGILSLDSVREANELKRKRDSGIADVGSDHGDTKSPRLELGDDTDLAIGGGSPVDRSLAAEGTILDIPADESVVPQDDDMEGSLMPAFDDTTAPLVHPADSGPVSLGTRHAVHVLRDIFGAEAATSADKRKKSTVVFQDLVSEGQTTKAEATKMFFECLVLATKDALKLEQGSGLGDPIKVRGKRGLWGDWAEREAGGEISNQNEPEPAAVSAPAVAVEA